MIIPKDPLERLLLVEQLVRECTASRVDRFNFYQVCRSYALFGTQDQQGCPYNKIKATLETLTSFIYSPDTTRFSLHLGVEAPEFDYPKAPVLGRELTDQWHKSNTSILFGKSVWWALVFGSMLIKTFWSGGVRSHLVEPHQFGVYQENVMELEDQEAFTHHYTITRSQLEGSLQGNPRKSAIMNRVGQNLTDQLPPISQGLQRLIVGSPVAGVPGSSAIPGAGNTVAGGIGGRGGPAYDYVPKFAAEVIDMVDLYVWDDEIEEYRVFTRAAPDVTIYDRPSSWLGHIRGVAPFTVVRGSDILYDYFWGDSFVADLTWLQDWRTERVFDVRGLLRKQFKPPMSVTGGTGITEEKLLTLYSPGGQLAFANPVTKVNVHEPKMPADVFAELQQIDGMFDDQAGIAHVLQGKGEAGVRSKGQVDLMARLSSSRPKKRALTIEAAAEDLAHSQLLLTQEHSTHRFKAPIEIGKPPIPFTAEQFTRDYQVKVDGHSSSPIFVEDRKHDAVTLREAKAIDRHTLLEMFDPPNVQDLQQRLKIIEKQEKEAEEMALQLQLSGGKAPKHGKGAA